MKNHLLWVVLALVSISTITFFGNGCGGGGDGSSSANCSVTSRTGNQTKITSPLHNVSNGGVSHASGGSSALTNCVSCHGSTLQGEASITIAAASNNTGADLTTSTPCCTTCHGQKW